ncbi:MAG: NADH-quinone oxidoreductase subunit J [Bdellovibrionales bacterium]|nr:NADH-quinone oxidoreductase subunit J [Bdellovibrionales bacterium]
MIVAMWIFGVLTVLSALGVVFAPRPLHSALWLVGTLFFLAVHFALMGADFIAALQVVVYAGAIMVLVVFVIMLLGLDEGPTQNQSRLTLYSGAIFCGLFLGLLLFAFTHQLSFPIGSGVSNGSVGDPREVGRVLVTDFLYAFEVIALLLFAAIIGAVLLANDRKRPLMPGRGLKAVQGSANDAASVEA